MSDKRFFELIEAPENYSVLSAIDDRAAICVRGILKEDTTDDTEIVYDFSYDCLYLRVLCEQSGALAAPPVRLSFSGDAFEAKLFVPVGGPYMLDLYYFNPSRALFYPLRGERRRHFFVGDVYLIAGQSNAAGMGQGALFEPMELGIQLLRDLSCWDIASAPYSDFDYSKQSMFLHFAKILKSETGRPIGLVPAAMGGAPLSRFLTEENGDLYHKMMSALSAHSITPKAVLWYQGCSDAGEGCGIDAYIERFSAFVKNIRKDLCDPDLPIYTFQLNRQIISRENEGLDQSYDRIREAQRRAAEQIPGVCVLPAIDGFAMSDFIHGSKTSNLAFGERLARTVLHKEYGIGEGTSVPSISSATLSQRKLTLCFKGVSSYLNDYHCGLRNLPISVSDKEGEVPLAAYRIDADKIILSLARDAVGEVCVSAQSGTDPRYIIADYLSGIPMLCFYNYPVKS